MSVHFWRSFAATFISFTLLPALTRSRTPLDLLVEHNHGRTQDIFTFSLVLWCLLTTAAISLAVYSSAWLGYFFNSKRLSVKFWVAVTIALMTISLLFLGILSVLLLLGFLLISSVSMFIAYIYLSKDRSLDDTVMLTGRYPYRIGRRIKITLMSSFALLIALLSVSLITYFTFPIPDYKVWDRDTGQEVVEVIPKHISSVLSFIYGIPGFASHLKLNHLFLFISEQSRKQYSHQLTTESEKHDAILNGFIVPYQIDMTIYNRPDYSQYSSVNDWFTRQVKPEYRLIGQGIVSAADSRSIVFPNLASDTKLWLKEEFLDVEEILGKQYEGNAKTDFADGSGAIQRLAPQDYHRVHVPLTGHIIQQYVINGPLLSVSEVAIRSRNRAIYNKRTVTIINTDKQVRYAVIAIGATAVGSIVFTRNVGELVKGGEDLLYFQFGGSTVVLLFPKDTVEFDEVLIRNSEFGVETFVKQGSTLATLR